MGFEFINAANIDAPGILLIHGASPTTSGSLDTPR